MSQPVHIKKGLNYSGYSFGGGGHTILNESGIEMTQRDKLQLVGLDVTDDNANNTTTVSAEKIQNQLTDQTNVLGAKNLLHYPYGNTTKVENGVTFTDNGDGTITISTVSSGATSDTSFVIGNNATNTSIKLSDGEYILSGCPSGGNLTTYYLDIYQNGTIIGTDIGEGVELHNILSSDTIGSNIQIKSGTIIITPITFYPMIRLASDPDNTYVPHAMTNRELTENVQTLDTNLKATYNNTEIPFVFGIDTNGNYGYKKAGADTVTPFTRNFQATIRIYGKIIYGGSGANTYNKDYESTYKDMTIKYVNGSLSVTYLNTNISGHREEWPKLDYTIGWQLTSASVISFTYI